MVMMLLWGHISPQLLQKVMALMSADLQLHKDGRLDVNSIDKLGGIGSKGTYPTNCWRDLQKLLPVPKLPSGCLPWCPGFCFCKHSVKKSIACVL